MELENNYFNSNENRNFILNNRNSLAENDGSQSEPMSLDSSPIINNKQPRHEVQNPEMSSKGNGNFYSLSVIPEKYRHIFASYPCFNAVQSKVLNDVLYSDVSVVVSAPTGSGKTVIFELAIIRLLNKLEETEYSQDFKIVYMAPIKALCSERYLDWNAKFSSFGLRCLEITGDTDDFQLASLSSYHLLMTTPEKWDSLTRKWKDNMGMVQMVKLFLIDEVHLLNEEKRGPALEVVVSRMKTIQEVITANIKQNQEQNSIVEENQTDFQIRFIAVSATIPNIEDLAQWLGTSHDKPAMYFKMSEDMRPVKLIKIVLGYSRAVNASQFRFEMSLSYKLRELLFKYAEGKPTLIFCSTRKGVEHTCATLVQQITFNFNPDQKEQLLQKALTLSENKLKDSIMVGVGYHHAGMLKEDRQIVEHLFRESELPVLVTTSTLAMGVNLPAHLVIIKGTQQYLNGSYKDYSETQILQMIGRAGRPQFDTTAVAVIMTQETNRRQYDNLVNGQEPIESNLHKHLAEHLNSEVVLRTITDIEYAIEWIRSTFLYVRALQNPKHYGISTKCNQKNIESKLQEMCQRELNALASAKLLQIDVMDVKPTSDGILMARYYLHLGTMKIFAKVIGDESLDELLHLLATCPEFSGIQLRVSEKKNLNLLNKSPDHKCIRFPLPTRIMTSAMKVNCLTQASFGCLTLYDHSLKQDMYQITWIGQRVSNALVQYLQCKSHYHVLLSAVLLSKCFRCKLWENSPYVSRQLKGIGSVLSTMLVASNKTSFQSIMESNPRDLESIINRPHPMGDNLIYAVSHLPQLELHLDTIVNQSSVLVKVNASVSNYELVIQQNTAGPNHWLFLLIGDSNNKCLYKERFRDGRLLEQGRTCWTVEIKDPSSVKEVFVDLISEQWVGLDVHSKITLKHPTQSPSKAKNTLEKIPQRKGANAKRKKCQTDSVANAKKKPSIIEQIREMSLQRLGMTPRTALKAFAFNPRMSSILKPSAKKINNLQEITSTVNNSKSERLNENVEFENANSSQNFLNNMIEVSQTYKQGKSHTSANENSIISLSDESDIEMTEESAPDVQCRNEGTSTSTNYLHTNSCHSNDISQKTTTKDGSLNSLKEITFPVESNMQTYKEHIENFTYRIRPQTSSSQLEEMKPNAHQTKVSLKNNAVVTEELYNLRAIDEGSNEISLPMSKNNQFEDYCLNELSEDGIPDSNSRESTFTHKRCSTVELYTGKNQNSIQGNIPTMDANFLSHMHKSRGFDNFTKKILSDTYTTKNLDSSGVQDNCTNLQIINADHGKSKNMCIENLQYDRSNMDIEYETAGPTVDTLKNSSINDTALSENLNNSTVTEANNNEIIPVSMKSPFAGCSISNALSITQLVPSASQCAGYSLNSGKYFNETCHAEESENNTCKSSSVEHISVLTCHRDEQDGFFDFSSILPAMLHQSTHLYKEDIYQTKNSDMNQYYLEKDIDQIQNSASEQITNGEAMNHATNSGNINNDSANSMTGQIEVSETFNEKLDGVCDFQGNDATKNMNHGGDCSEEQPDFNSDIIPTTDMQIILSTEQQATEMNTSNEKPSIFSRNLPNHYYPIFNKIPQYNNSDTSDLSQFSVYHNVTDNTQAMKDHFQILNSNSFFDQKELIEIEAVDNYFKQTPQNSPIKRTYLQVSTEGERKDETSNKEYLNTPIDNHNYNEEKPHLVNTMNLTNELSPPSTLRHLEINSVPLLQQGKVQEINSTGKRCSKLNDEQKSEIKDTTKPADSSKLLKHSQESLSQVGKHNISKEMAGEENLVNPFQYKTATQKILKSEVHQQKLGKEETADKQCFKLKYHTNIKEAKSVTINEQVANSSNTTNQESNQVNNESKVHQAESTNETIRESNCSEPKKFKVIIPASDKTDSSLNPRVNSRILQKNLTNIPKKDVRQEKPNTKITGINKVISRPILNFKLFDDIDNFIASIPELNKEDIVKLNSSQTCKMKTEFRHKARSSPPYRHSGLEERLVSYRQMAITNYGVDKILPFPRMQPELVSETRERKENRGLEEERMQQPKISSNNFHQNFLPLQNEPHPTSSYGNQDCTISSTCNKKSLNSVITVNEDTSNMKKINEEVRGLSYEELNKQNFHKDLGITPLKYKTQDGKKSFSRISDMLNFSQTHFTFDDNSRSEEPPSKISDTMNISLFEFQDRARRSKQQYKEIPDHINMFRDDKQLNGNISKSPNISPLHSLYTETPTSSSTPISDVYNSPDISPSQFSPDMPRSGTLPSRISSDNLDVSSSQLSSPDVSGAGIESSRNIFNTPEISTSELMLFATTNGIVPNNNLDNVQSQNRYEEMTTNRKHITIKNSGNLYMENGFQNSNRSDMNSQRETQFLLQPARFISAHQMNDHIPQSHPIQIFQRSDHENEQDSFHNNLKHKLSQYQRQPFYNIHNNHKDKLSTNSQFYEFGNKSQQELHNYYREKKPVFRKSMQHIVSPKYESQWKKFEMQPAKPKDKFSHFYSNGSFDSKETGYDINRNISVDPCSENMSRFSTQAYAEAQKQTGTNNILRPQVLSSQNNRQQYISASNSQNRIENDECVTGHPVRACPLPTLPRLNSGLANTTLSKFGRGQGIQM